MQRVNRLRCFRRQIGAWVMVVLAIGVLSEAGADKHPPVQPLRIGFASNLFAGVDENDAKAAISIWGDSIADEKNVTTGPDPVIFQPQIVIFREFEALLNSLQAKSVDAVVVNVIDYDRLRETVTFDPILLSIQNGRATHRYVLVAHRESSLKSVADLAGCVMILENNATACLASSWLDVQLLGQGLAPASGLAAKITESVDPARAVLPVFFRQADACVVTRAGFDKVGARNRQVAEQLVVLAESPEMAWMVFAFRADYAPPARPPAAV
jgi:phosphonate transport system substrate-binding protein